MKEKLRILLFPFIVISAGLTIVYNLIYGFLLHFFYPLFYNNTGIIVVSAFILAWIPVLIWMRPRINLLVLDRIQVENDFYISCMQKFENVNFESLTYLEKVEKSTTLNCYQKAIELSNNSIYTTGGFILEPKFEAFTMRWYSKLSSALVAFICCAAGWLLVLLFVKFDHYKLQIFLTRIHK